MRYLVLILLAVAACWTRPREAAPVAARSSPPVLREIELRHGLMTFVMDSPRGQRDKAHTAVARSVLAQRIGELGHSLVIAFDEASGDDVVVLEHGRELGRMSLHDVAGGKLAADLERALR